MKETDHVLNTENDPEAYEKAGELVTTESDRDVWVVQCRYDKSQDWRVAAVLTSYEDAEAFIEDHRDFIENCPEGAPETFARNSAYYRLGSRNSPNKFFETWPPGEE